MFYIVMVMTQMMKNIRHKDNRNAEIEFGFKNESSLELEIEPCGHLAVYHVYSDCDGCVMCDKEMLSDS